MARNVPEQPADGEEDRELIIELHLPARMKLSQVIALEEALSTGVKPLVEWLVTNAGCDRKQLDDLDWEQIDQLREQVKQAVLAKSKVPPKKS